MFSFPCLTSSSSITSLGWAFAQRDCFQSLRGCALLFENTCQLTLALGYCPHRQQHKDLAGLLDRALVCFIQLISRNGIDIVDFAIDMERVRLILHISCISLKFE